MTPYILLLYLAAVASFLWAIYGIYSIRNRKPNPSVAAFVVLCLAASIWAFVYAAQLASTTLEAKLLAYKLLHIGGVLVPPAWFAFALAFSGRSKWLTPTTVAGMLLIPLALLLTLSTNLYSLALTSSTVDTSGSLVVLVTENGPLYQLYLAYAYIVIPVGSWLIVSHAIRSATVIRRQAALLVTGAAVPLVINIFNVLSIPPIGDIGVNITPVSLAFSTILFGVAIFRYRMLDLTPIAWDPVFDQMSDGVIILDDRERIVDLNPSGETLLGEREDIFGVDVGSLLPEYNRRKRDYPFRLTVSRLDEKGGDERIVQVTRSPLISRGKKYGWAVLAHDVTVLERQRKELEQKNERLDAFTKTVSHDLRNPLAVVEGYTTLAQETGEARDFDQIHGAISDMKTFLEDLLLLSQNGETIDDKRPVSVATVAGEVNKGMAGEQVNLTIETDVVVMADRNRLYQVLDNLFRNARDHGDGDTVVHLGVLPNGFFIEDEGPGIPVDMRETAFEVGYTTRAEGSGFGLAIIRDIVEAHGWSISVTEGVGGGARFEIIDVDIPLADHI